MINRYRPHVLILPEDAANGDIANGFVRCVDHERAVQILPAAGGWSHARNALRDEHVPELRKFGHEQLVVLIDFDGRAERREDFAAVVPPDLTDRLFVVGVWTEVEELRQSLASRGLVRPNTLEGIGELLADECRDGPARAWGDDLLTHNASELARMRAALRPLLFQP
ncbi:MAG: hypothetical protein NT029_20765 [Armatimonadetes bacterium]|nr:hypothetical protein [Armatimonadota bacterium]